MKKGYRLQVAGDRTIYALPDFFTVTYNLQPTTWRQA